MHFSLFLFLSFFVFSLATSFKHLVFNNMFINLLIYNSSYFFSILAVLYMFMDILVKPFKLTTWEGERTREGKLKGKRKRDNKRRQKEEREQERERKWRQTERVNLFHYVFHPYVSQLYPSLFHHIPPCEAGVKFKWNIFIFHTFYFFLHNNNYPLHCTLFTE